MVDVLAGEIVLILMGAIAIGVLILTGGIILAIIRAIVQEIMK